METAFIWVIIGGIAFMLLSMIAVFLSFYKKVPQGKAIIRTGAGGTLIEYDKGIFAIPNLHKVTYLDISFKKIELHQVKEEGLICKDGTKTDIKAAFFIRVSKEIEAMNLVAQTIGCETASDPKALSDLFHPKFLEATMKVMKKYNYRDLYNDIDLLKREILINIGVDLNGFILDDVAIDFFEKTKPQYLETNA